VGDGIAGTGGLAGRAGGSIPPLAGAGAVFLLGGIVLLALARPRPRDLDRRELRRAALAGVLLTARRN
jgi:hypothetical protein